ncbi:MAG: hypothetical protein RBT80_17695 [Candidatus Vecturithrix sp.]|jgi:methyl-accepting chemotaxis protein|nr:hypothetical protein [Candidatus Vecturithrix sp.]
MLPLQLLSRWPRAASPDASLERHDSAFASGRHECQEDCEYHGVVSQELSTGAEQLSNGASEQAASMEESSSSMEEMAANIRQNADNARETEKIAVQSEDSQDAATAICTCCSAQ